MKYLILNIAFWLSIVQVNAQEVLYFELNDGTTVSLVSGKSSDEKELYYYIPTNFRTSTNKEDLPEFSLMYYTEEETEEAILHFIITWGLTEQQQTYVEKLLNEAKEKPAFIMGAIDLNSAKDFTISQNTKLGEILNRSLTAKSKAPLLPAAKMAISFKINSEDTKALKTLLEDKAELETTYFNFNYKSLTNKTPYKTLEFNIPFIKFFNSKL